jgi:hypothetical protein
LVWDCHQSPLKLAEHNRIQLMGCQDSWGLMKVKSINQRRLFTSTHRA